MRDQLEAKAKTTAGIFKVNQADLATCVLPLPPSDEQIRVRTAIDTLLNHSQAILHIVHTAQARAQLFRQSILDCAFEGTLSPPAYPFNPDTATPNRVPVD